MVDERARGFGGVAVAPMRDADPVADLGTVGAQRADAAAADDPSVGERDHERGLRRRSRQTR